MQEFVQHQRKVLAYLGGTGDCDVMGVGQIGYNTKDNTLRIHNGCTKGGFLKLPLIESCPKVIKVLDPSGVVKGPIRILQHAEAVSVATLQTLGAVKFEFTAAWPELQEEVISVKFAIKNPVPSIKELNGGTFVENITAEINDTLNQYGIEAAGIADNTLFEKAGRVAVRGPDSLGAWELKMIDGRGDVTIAKVALKKTTIVAAKKA